MTLLQNQHVFTATRTAHKEKTAMITKVTDDPNRRLSESCEGKQNREDIGPGMALVRKPRSRVFVTAVVHFCA